MCKENKNKIVMSDIKFNAKAITLKNSQNQIKYELSMNVWQWASYSCAYT